LQSSAVEAPLPASKANSRGDARETTVTRIATDHGFWELGRFSVAYRTLFGETPLTTLRRPAELVTTSTVLLHSRSMLLLDI
jgi:hypothetical protein